MYAIYSSTVDFRSIKTPSPKGEGRDEGKFYQETLEIITNRKFKSNTSKQSTQAHHQCCNDKPCRADFSPHNQYNRLLMLPHSGLKSALQGSIAVWIVSFFLTFSAIVATANPNGGQVVAGEASISSQGNSLDINQNSHKAIIDWRSFNISQGEQTNFKQPSASALTLNRVRGEQLSQINGQLNANGQVFLINPQGVIFGPNAQVTTGGLVATTADIRNDDFIAGNYQFDQASPNPNASITNQGHISTHDGGAIILAAPTVNNEGTIQARLGNVNLASANTFTLDFHGDGLLSFEVQGQITQKPDSVSDDAALVNNSGTIIADGGTVTLTAQAADAVIDRVINMDGIIQATTLGEDKGKIILSGGDHSIVDVSGTLDVSGSENNETGGVVHVLGEKVGLFDGTHINAEGYAGGGEVLVGGNFQGKGPEANAKRTYVAKKAKINASATKTGDGGQVIVWADGTTQYYGDIAANGGEQSGDGGFVEVSGKQNLDFQGTVSLTAPKGKIGTLLLDPSNITIVDAKPQDQDYEVSDGKILFDETDEYRSNGEFPTIIIVNDFTLSNDVLQTIQGNVVLQAANNIDIEAPLDFKDIDEAGEEGIIFQANQLNINANITTHGGDIHFEAGHNPPRPTHDTRFFPDSSTINLNENVKLASNGSESNGGNITLIAQRIDLKSGSEINAGAGNISLAKILGERGLILNAADIIVGDAIGSASDVFIATDDFNQMETTGSLFLGSATTAGTDGLIRTDAVELIAPDITINSNTQFNGRQVILTAQKDIFLNQEITTQGGTLILNPAREDVVGKVYIEPVQISTNGGNVFINGDTTITSEIGKTTLSTNGGTIFLLGTTKASETSIERSLTLNSGENGRILLGDIEQTDQTSTSPIISVGRVPSVNNLELVGELITLTGNVTTLGDQIYTGDVILNGNYKTNGGVFTVTGLTTLAGTTSVSTGNSNSIIGTGGNIQFGNIKGNLANSLVLGGPVTINVINESLLLNNPQNDFIGTLNLNVTGSENIAIADINLLQLGTLNIGANQLSIAAQDLDILGSLTTTGGGSLILGPIAQTQSIGVGDGAGTFSLIQSEIDNITDGFSSITIGRTDLTGAVTIDNASFTDPLIVEAAGAGASITVNGVLTGNKNASITLNGSGETTFLNGNIITAGNPITINGAVILENSVLLDTTAAGSSQGVGITVVGSVNATTPLTVTAGAGAINLTNQANNITGSLIVNNTGNNNVNVTNNALLTLGTSNVGNGQLNFTGTQITQTGAITQEPGASTSSFTASTGAIDLTQNNDFTSTVRLSTTGANEISIVDNNTLDLGTSTIGTGNFTVTAGDLNVVGTVSNAGGSLTLQPFAFDQNVSINSALGSFSLSSTDFSNLQDGFSTITIGRTDLTGAVTIDNASFTDPLIVEAAGAGASITVNGVLTGDDNASITLIGSGETTFLNGNIITAGNPITINDTVILGNSVLLDTTAGGGSQGAGITVSGSVNGTTPLIVTAGAGAINLTNQANNITGSLIVNNTGNNNVNVTNNALLTLGTSNVGNGQLNFTGTQITQTGAITQEPGAAASSFTASTGAIDLTQNNDFTSTVSLNTTGENDISIVDINTLDLGASTIGTGNFTVTAGDLNVVGAVSNAGGSLTLQPFAFDQNVSINSALGSFSLSSTDFSNLQDGFSTITIGRSGLTGNVTFDNASFTDPLIVQADGTGGSITVNGVLTGTDDASITLNGSGNTTFLNGNILTTGNPIIINDAIILGNTVLLDTTSSGAFAGAGITLNGTVNRGAALTPLTLSAGSNTGDILFTGDVGVNTQLGDVTVLSANNITMNGRFLANDTRLTFSGLWQNNSNLPLNVNSLFVTPLAQGATVFGRVNTQGGLFAATEVTGVSNDLRYTINGCVMGVFCGITGVPDTNIPDLPRSDTDALPVAKLELMNIWEQQKRLQDPRDERYSNLGNEELWWERKGGVKDAAKY